MLEVKHIKEYVVKRIADLECERLEVTQPVDKFQAACALAEMNRLSSWIEVQQCADTAEDMLGIVEGGREL